MLEEFSFMLKEKMLARLVRIIFAGSLGFAVPAIAQDATIQRVEIAIMFGETFTNAMH